MLMPVKVQAPVAQAVTVGEAMFMAFIDFVPAPEVLIVEAMFKAFEVPPLLALVDSSTRVNVTRLPLSSSVVWTYFVEALPTANIVPEVWAEPPVKVRPVWVVSVPQSKVWVVAPMAIAPLPDGSPMASQAVAVPPASVPQVKVPPATQRSFSVVVLQAERLAP